MENASAASNQSSRADAALTPRPVRLLLVGRVKPGAEPALRRVQATFPRDAATEAGIDAVEAFIGSGTYAVQFEISRNDVQQVLAAFLNDPRVRAFRDQLEPVTEGLPGPDYQFGGAADEASSLTVYNTGDLHFAASMYRWRAGESPKPGAEPLATMLDQVQQDIAPMAADKALSFAVDLPAALPLIQCDPLRLRQILLNLVGNAAKFAHAGAITVQGEQGVGSAFTLLLPLACPATPDRSIRNEQHYPLNPVRLGLAGVSQP